MRVIIVTADKELRNFCLQQTEKLGVDCDTVTSLSELFEDQSEIYYHGLLIDLSVSIKAGREEKNKAHEFLPHFPLLRLKWNSETQKLNCLLQNSVGHAGITIATFIDHHCRPFKPRKIRVEKRLPLHFSVLISQDSKFQRSEVERSTTLDISPGGCSLLTTQQWDINTCIWLRFVQMEDQTPIKGIICRWICWGTPMKIPSIGVRFESLTESQQQQLSSPAELMDTLR
ncbi:MAG: PilZ domain-containing protein, partial [Thermodesulfobacteriota bacterium]|nr:PilZ domain-containing protein [Thermodesulfobacteriota bacterium]